VFFGSFSKLSIVGLTANNSVLTESDSGENSAPSRRVVVATSSGIRAITHIEHFLGVDAVVAPAELVESDEVLRVVVWGRKDTATTALNYASKHNLSPLYLEDGWIRSSSENAHSRLSYSLLLDEEGVYYDASQPSQIECLLNQDDEAFNQWCSANDIAYAQKCRRMLVDSNITKYNYCKSAELSNVDNNIVLVIDQTFDDASVLLGGMNQQRFIDMLTSAVDENPNATVIVRTHPDVVIGRKRGYLTDAAKSLGIAISALGDNPLPWLKHASRVYTGTSQMGYEALLCETPVTVFGQPFYAGWGLTDDRQTIERRTSQRNVDELFHVAHVSQTHYLNPVTAERWQLHECLEHVQLQKMYFDKNALDFHCFGVTPWKRGYIKQYLRSPDGSVTFKSKLPKVQHSDPNIVEPSLFEANNTKAKAKANRAADKRVNATWSFRHFDTESTIDINPINEVYKSGKRSCIVRMEDGFLRSTGLGSDFTAPGSLVIDHTGLYFDPSSASDLETLLNSRDLTPADIRRAQQIRQRILSAGLSKYNVGEMSQKFAKTAVTKSVLVVGQVEDDASIQRGCAQIASNAALLQAVREAEPESYIVYKPHPDVMAGNRKGSVSMPLKWADEVNTTSSITAGLAWCDELHTMTSLAGFEALMRNKRVVTYGLPFYAGWGLTVDRGVCERRKRSRTLDELVFMALIEYPRYLDVASGEFMLPETMVTRLENEQLEARASTYWMQRQVTKVVNMVKGCRYAR